MDSASVVVALLSSSQQLLKAWYISNSKGVHSRYILCNIFFVFSVMCKF